MEIDVSPIRTAKMQQRAQRFGNVVKSQRRQEPLSLQINQFLVSRNFVVALIKKTTATKPVSLLVLLDLNSLQRLTNNIF